MDKTIEGITVEEKSEIIDKILKRVRPCVIMQKHMITYGLLRSIRDEVYPENGKKIYPIRVELKSDIQHYKGLSHTMYITEKLEQIKVGQELMIKKDDRYCLTKVVQKNDFAIFVKINNRVECINIADLASRDVVIVGSDNYKYNKEVQND